jgi:hypothetical protein
MPIVIIIVGHNRTEARSSTAADTIKFRTATYRDGAHAKDLKNKRKSIKCKPDKVECGFNLIFPDVDEETGALGQKFTSVKKMMLVR